jgi:hypothetical protein
MRHCVLAASLAAATLLAGTAHADVCFTVLDNAGKILRQSRQAPVDMSRPISATLYTRFPTASVMVFGANNDTCQEMSAPSPATVTAPPRRPSRRM